MNRANQLQLVQNVNQQLVLIRGIELNYYLNLYQSFLTQALVIGGFTYSTISQNTFSTDNFEFPALRFCYYIFSVLTIVTSSHVVYCTMFMVVFSQGLALNGPLGSMAKAIKGLAVEQEQVILSFNIMLLSFAISSVFFFWIVMEIEASIAGTIVMCFATCCWYIYGERIYLRFYWNRKNDGWDQHKDIADEDNDEPTLESRGIEYPYITTTNNNITGVNNNRNNKQTNHDDEVILASLDASKSSSQNDKRIVTEGYLTMKSSTSLHGIIKEKKKWHRRYGVLLGSGVLYIYKTRLDYRKDPTAPIYTRPLKINEFYVKVQNLELDNRIDNEMDGSEQQSVVGDDVKSMRSGISYTVGSATSSSSVVVVASRFQLTLIPRDNLDLDDETIRNLWLLCTDTEEELDIWIEGLQGISLNSFNKDVDIEGNMI